MRARATALVLVNWKGVFYERYLLDRHVTSLEGANGAGKTTVMIAAYVVLLPDMSRLRFTNLGESAATGGDRGIWGRLGEPGRPSYAALELELGPSERIVLGVHLERKSEPSVEPRAFIVSGLGPELRLQDLFLVTNGADEAVPVLDELIANARRLGVQLDVFRSTKDYFSELFERGISPLRLAAEEERSKFNEMLRTSMTGGISRALTTELRTFLLRQETGLSDALSRMRANLDTCRRTRTEVVEAQRLEREISAVLEAAQSMMRLVARALEREVSEASEQTQRLLAERDRARDAVRRYELDREAASARERALAEELARLRAERDRASEERRRALEGRELAAKLAALEPERVALEERLAAAKQARDSAAARRDQAQRARRAAEDAMARAASGLARLEAGLEELQRRTHAYRALVAQLELARTALERPELEVERAAAALDDARARLAELDREGARRARELEGAGARRAEFERAFRALVTLVPRATAEDAFALARSELARARALEAEVASLPELEREQRAREAARAERRALFERAAALGVTLDEADAVGSLTEAWNAAERALSDAERQLRELERSIHEHRSSEHALAARLGAIERERARYAEHRERVARLQQALGQDLPDASALHRARSTLGRELEELRAQARDLGAEREAALELSARLEAARGAVPPELLRIADELDAELLATRFEDLAPDVAVQAEALLGPLSDALVVEDPLAAARALASSTRTLSDVRFVAADALGAIVARVLAPVEAAGSDVIVQEADAVRVSRRPEVSKLGRRARLAHAEALRTRAESLATEVERLQEAVREREGLLRDVERAIAERAAFEERDPDAELAAVNAALETARAALVAAEQSLGEAGAHERACRERVLGLRGLVAASRGLAANDAGVPESELLARLERARRGRQELEQSAQARAILTESLDALRVPPLPEAELRRFEAEQSALSLERDRVFSAVRALEYLVEHRADAAFHDAERALASDAAIAPSLEAERRSSEQELDRADAELRLAEAEWEEKTRELSRAEAELLALRAVQSRDAEALAALGPCADFDGAIAELEARIGALDQRLEALSRDERASSRELVLLDERLERARSGLAELEQRVAAAEGRSAPLSRDRNELLRRAAAVGALELDAEPLVADSRSSSELWAETRGKRELLLERLERARGGAERARSIRATLAAAGERGAEAYVEVWNSVRDWLLACLPSSVAEASDPVQGIDNLRRHLAALEQRLERQEADLRGTSEDVARSIDVQIRRAQSQVRRLNQHLTGVSFGSIRAIRVRMSRIERMDQVLKALREGATQELLFQPTLPIEEALNEIFRRYGGGKTGGQRLLDYREYLELSVEICRREGGEFEAANPSRLSTGEAIGVGAALMMVVLTEWERDANLFRGKRPIGSLRFLFLDEANRLSQDNLGVLFDLCQGLDLQLLIAAPEVARAEGNTTYRLVRQRTPDGREEVIVSGRRGLNAPA